MLGFSGVDSSVLCYEDIPLLPLLWLCKQHSDILPYVVAYTAVEESILYAAADEDIMDLADVLEELESYFVRLRSKVTHCY